MSFTIGIISDTHLGAFSLDQELNKDPFEAFEEALDILVKNGADLILHAGDFYHKGDPPPWIQHEATSILRSKITGAKPTLKVLEGEVNFEAEDVNISVPLFLIHGTHDRPVGRPAPGPPFQHLVAAGYANYIDIDRANSFASRYIVLEKGGVKVLVTGVGHRPEGYINASILEQGIPFREDCVSLCCVHNCVENIVPTSGEYLDLRLFHRMNFVIVGHGHSARLNSKRQIVPMKQKGLGARILAPGATTVVGFQPQEEGPKYAHILELSPGKVGFFRSFELRQARRVFHRSLYCENLTANEVRSRIERTLAELPLKGLEKRALVRIYVTGKLAAGCRRDELRLEELASRYKDKVYDWSDMIVPSDLYTEDELKRLEELRGAMEAGSALSGPFERFAEKLRPLGFKGKYYTPEEIYRTFSEVASSTAARRRVKEKLNEVLEVEHN